MAFRVNPIAILLTLLGLLTTPTRAADPPTLRLSWKANILTVSGPTLPGRDLRILYIEAYCRPGSTDRDWKETTIGHTTKLLSTAEDGHALTLECTLRDGVTVRHDITAAADEIDFRIVATNPTDKPSQADWAQPCVRVDAFTGRDQKTYLEKCFIFLGGKLTRMPTRDWATNARYTPGQVWAPPNINRNDVNPRPLSPATPDNGLIGCFSADEKQLLAIAFEPYQELFQGVATCLHTDFRIGGLQPHESKKVRGKIYLLKNDTPALLTRYQKDFPEHHTPKPPHNTPPTPPPPRSAAESVRDTDFATTPPPRRRTP